jgi:hypothetical protein
MIYKRFPNAFILRGEGEKITFEMIVTASHSHPKLLFLAKILHTPLNLITADILQES